MAKNKKGDASFDETPPESMLIKAYWLVSLDSNLALIGCLDEGPGH